jgi:putative molybdopterin biosynthesis protein
VSIAPRIENNLAAIRHKRGFSAAQLAELVAVSRQTIYAMETGAYVPNTAVTLRLARALEVSVEELFSLRDDAPPVSPRTEKVTVLPGSDKAGAGQPVQLCRVGKRITASVPAPVPWYLPVADAVIMGSASSGKKTGAKVQLFREDEELGNRLLVAGCDPAISVLARHVQRAGVDLVVAHRNSSQALALLKKGAIHIAGSHLRDEVSGEPNLPAIRRIFPKNSVAVISFALWEEGLVIARGNPKCIGGVEDLGAKGVLIVNREPGAGARILLDSQLRRMGLNASLIRGYERIAHGHLPAAWHVATGQADCCIATRAAARLFALDFIPLVSERYDLVIRRSHLSLPTVQLLLDALSRTGFRRELQGVGGYDTSVSGYRQL